MGYCIAPLPMQMASLIHLTYLSLWVARIRQGDLCILGDIPALLCSALSYTYSMPLMNGLPSAASNSGASRSLCSSSWGTEVAWRCCFYRMRCQSSEVYILYSERRKQSPRWGLSSVSSTLQAWSTSASKSTVMVPPGAGGGCGGCCQERCQHPPRTSHTWSVLSCWHVRG